MWGVRTGVAAAVGLALLLLPAPVQADVVFQKGADIWVMEDDGSNARVLVRASDVPQMDNGIGSPHVDPTGTNVVFTGSTKVYQRVDNGMCGGYPYYYPCWTYHNGLNATGVYVLEGGTVTRKSSDPGPCHECTSLESSPEFAPGGKRYAYSLMHCTGTRSRGTHDCNTGVGTAGDGAASFKTACGEGDAVLFAPTFNPRNPAQIAYADCSHGTGETEREALYVSEPDRANEHPVACDDAPLADPSFAPAGDRLVVAQAGEAPGLWVYDPSRNACDDGGGVHALVNSDPDNLDFSTPRFMGPDRLIFAAAVKSGESWTYDLYTIASSCSGCQFPADATRLTTDAANTSPSWTSASLAVVPPQEPAKEPGKNSEVADDSTVTPSSGACTAPKVRGLTRKAALRRVRAAGCTAKVRRVRHRKVRKGRVVRASVRPGRAVAAGSRMTLYVSKGRR